MPNADADVDAGFDAMSFSLPLVDFASFASPSDHDEHPSSPSPRLAVAREIDRANRTRGFVCLRNSGVSKTAVREAFDSSRALFSLTGVEKEKLRRIDPANNVGYVGCGAEALNRRRATDLKEAFNVRINSDDGYFEGTPPSFRLAATGLWEELVDLARRYAACCAMALGLEEDYFYKTLEEMDLCTLRMLHYPPCARDDVTDGTDSECAIRVGEHTDFGIFTFLFIDDVAEDSSLGLQIKHPGGDGVDPHWQDVAFDKDALNIIEKDETAALVVNTGALLARWTNDVWTATAHRVVVSPRAFSSHRYSIAMFLDPDKETLVRVHEKFVPEGEEPRYGDIRSFDYLLMKLREAQGVEDGT